MYSEKFCSGVIFYTEQTVYFFFLSDNLIIFL